LPDNPVSDDQDYRIEVIVAVPQLDRLDKDRFNDKDKQEAASIREERREEELLLVSGQLAVLKKFHKCVQ